MILDHVINYLPITIYHSLILTNIEFLIYTKLNIHKMQKSIRKINLWLSKSARLGLFDKVTLLHSLGATDFNWALANASAYGHTDIVIYLLNKAVNIKRPFTLAVANNHLLIMKILFPYLQKSHMLEVLQFSYLTAYINNNYHAMLLLTHFNNNITPLNDSQLSNSLQNYYISTKSCHGKKLLRDLTTKGTFDSYNNF